MNYYVIKNDELYHYGVKGMKWHKHLHSRDKNVIDGVANVSKGDNPIWIHNGALSFGVGKNSIHPRRYMHQNVKTYNNAMVSHKPGGPARPAQYGSQWIKPKNHERNRTGKAAEEHKKTSLSKAVDAGKNFVQKLLKKNSK